jgi:SAM-dependent methyltransferase
VVSLLLLGCGGQEARPGWVHHDRGMRPGVDVAHDLEVRPWPWADDSAEEIEARHVLEHLADCVGFMDECWRVLRPGGRLRVWVPDWRHENAWRDPTHKRCYHPDTFAYFDPETSWGQMFGRFYTERTWRLMVCGTNGEEIEAVLEKVVSRQ